MKKALHILCIALLTSLATSSFAQMPRLFVTAEYGGANGGGTILESDYTGTGFHKVYDFHFDIAGAPTDNLVWGSNGEFYGTTWLGGFADSCVIYRFDTLTNICDSVYNFFHNTQHGAEPFGGMIKANDGKLYGTASAGLNGYGVIFSFDPATLIYNDVYDFNLSNGGGVSSCMMQASNGIMYGITGSGGANNLGVIYSFDPATLQYNDVFDLDSTTGFYSTYTHFIQATDGKLYGMLNQGGAYNQGTLFSFDYNNNSVVVLNNFKGTDGYSPNGSLIQATDGKLYGMTTYGGENDLGTIFSYDLTNSTYNKLFSFVSASGQYPMRSLMQASNGMMYGTTSSGGLNNNGVIFSFDATTNTYTNIFDFINAMGTGPQSDLSEPPAEIVNALHHVYANNSVSITPNPATDLIKISSAEKGSIIQLTDVTGKILIQTTATENTTIDISKLDAGVYFVRTKTGIQNFVKQ